MTVEEDRLAHWLRTGTPDPSFAVRADSVLRRARRRRQLRIWSPAVAAACIVVLIAALLAALPDRHVVQQHAAEPTHVSTPAPTTHARHSSNRLGVRPWHSRLVSSAVLSADSLDTDGGRLYGFASQGRATIAVRIDPGDGAEEASAPAGADVNPSPVLAGGFLWTLKTLQNPSDGHPAVEIEKRDPQTLSVVHTTTIPGHVSLMRSSANGSVLLVANAKRVSFLDRDTGAVASTYEFSSRVSDAAVTPDGSTLYLTSGSQTRATVTAVDVHTQTVKSTVPLDSGAGGLQATNTGFFITTSSGMAAYSEFYRTAVKTPKSLTPGGGGVDPEIHLSGGVAWAGGSDELACINPATGRVRARVQIGGSQAAITGLTAVRGGIFAVYHGLNKGPSNALIRMTPPKRCGSS